MEQGLLGCSRASERGACSPDWVNTPAHRFEEEGGWAKAQRMEEAGMAAVAAAECMKVVVAAAVGTAQRAAGGHTAVLADARAAADGTAAMQSGMAAWKALLQQESGGGSRRSYSQAMAPPRVREWVQPAWGPEQHPGDNWPMHSPTLPALRRLAWPLQPPCPSSGFATRPGRAWRCRFSYLCC